MYNNGLQRCRPFLFVAHHGLNIPYDVVLQLVLKPFGLGKMEHYFLYNLVRPHRNLTCASSALKKPLRKPAATTH